MFKHIGMLTLQDEAGDAGRKAIASGLLGLVGLVPGLRSAEVFTDAGLDATTADLLFIMTFGDEDAWRAYSSHPAHRALLADVIGPRLVDKRFLQAAQEQVSP